VRLDRDQLLRERALAVGRPVRGVEVRGERAGARKKVVERDGGPGVRLRLPGRGAVVGVDVEGIVPPDREDEPHVRLGTGIERALRALRRAARGHDRESESDREDRDLRRACV